jgi:hypothetical protein
MIYEEYLQCAEGDVNNWNLLLKEAFSGDYALEELSELFGYGQVQRFLKSVKPRKPPPYIMADREYKRKKTLNANKSKMPGLKYQKWSKAQKLILQSYYDVNSYISNRDTDKTRLGSLLAELEKEGIKGMKVSKGRVLRWFKYQRNKSDSTLDGVKQFES